MIQMYQCQLIAEHRHQLRPALQQAKRSHPPQKA